MSESQRCNLCGKELDFFDRQEDFTIIRKLGYGTRYDGEHMVLRLCCNCMEKLIESCSVDPLAEEVET